MSYDAVIFDNDGVLTHLTDAELLRTAAEAAFAEFDADPTAECVASVLHGDLDRVRRVCEFHNLDHGAFWARREAHASAVQRAALDSGDKPLYDDVAALYALAGREVPAGFDAHCASLVSADGGSDTVAAGAVDPDAGGDAGAAELAAVEPLSKPVEMAIVSNNQHATVQHIVDVFDLGDLFVSAYGKDPTIDGLARMKPDPHYIERALADLDADRVLYVGDSNVDILAADRAGVDSAFVRRPHRVGYKLVAEPTYELDSLYELTALAG
jgi:phosphoglycolate phosphatase-like HAD superfamily hydrolase